MFRIVRTLGAAISVEAHGYKIFKATLLSGHVKYCFRDNVIEAPPFFSAEKRWHGYLALPGQSCDHLGMGRRRMNLTSLLYRAARASAWIRVGSRAAQGRPLPLLRRIRNRFIMRAIGRLLRK